MSFNVQIGYHRSIYYFVFSGQLVWQICECKGQWLWGLNVSCCWDEFVWRIHHSRLIPLINWASDSGCISKNVPRPLIYSSIAKSKEKKSTTVDVLAKGPKSYVTECVWIIACLKIGFKTFNLRITELKSKYSRGKTTFDSLT